MEVLRPLWFSQEHPEDPDPYEAGSGHKSNQFKIKSSKFKNQEGGDSFDGGVTSGFSSFLSDL